MKNTCLSVLLIIGIMASSKGQNLEFDFGFGAHLSNINFHHTSNVDSDQDSEFQSFSNSNFNIGLTSPIGNRNYYLKTEIGFIKTNSFISARFTYNEGFGDVNGSIISYLTNQKIYLGILPEYRYRKDAIIVKFSGGVLLSSDISNTFSSNNIVFLPKSAPFGMKVGTSLQYMWNKIGLEIKVSYAKFGVSELQNRWRLKVSYDLILINWGVVYSL